MSTTKQQKQQQQIDAAAPSPPTTATTTTTTTITAAVITVCLLYIPDHCSCVLGGIGNAILYYSRTACDRLDLQAFILGASNHKTLAFDLPCYLDVM